LPTEKVADKKEEKGEEAGLRTPAPQKTTVLHTAFSVN
jgi:hypothetical protein